MRKGLVGGNLIGMEQSPMRICSDAVLFYAVYRVCTDAAYYYAAMTVLAVHEKRWLL